MRIGTVLALVRGTAEAAPVDAGFAAHDWSGRGPDPGCGLAEKLPVTLGWFSTAAIARMARSSTLEALGAHYVTVARAKGLRESTILLHHALPNTLTAIISLSSLQFVTLASGAVITEAIFDWPGIGLLMVQGAFARDYSVVQGVVLLAAVLTITVNLLVDIAYRRLDPRMAPAAGR